MADLKRRFRARHFLSNFLNFFMTDRPAPPVFIEPTETISHWSIKELEFEGSSEKARHLVGLVPSKMTMRVTTPIRSFNYEKLQVVTSSGRLYYLDAQPNLFKELEYSFSVWMRNNNVKSQLDVTHEYLRTH